MNKSILWLICLLFVTSLSIVSCSESDGAEDPYANWEERNQKYIDSIAQLARKNEGNEPGQWKVIRSYKLGDPVLGEEVNVNQYVYCKIIDNDGVGQKPLFKDSVDVNYRGELIPLLNGKTVVFDQSYTGNLDPEMATPSGFRVNQVITGWTTALQQMRVGDRWEVYIPYDLAYGQSGQSSIPGYSTLIFDVDLVDIFPLKGSERSIGEGFDAE